jgi:hypothetical protein
MEMREVKESVHRLTDQLQLILSYIELGDQEKALAVTKLAVKEIQMLAKRLAGMASSSAK